MCNYNSKSPLLSIYNTIFQIIFPLAIWAMTVMESLPLMLQAALLLLGCALSRYLWETNVTIASVVIGVTSFGIIFYLFIVVAGAGFESCPYQTPGAPLFRHVFFHNLLPVLRSVSSFISSRVSNSVRISRRYIASITWRGVLDEEWFSIYDIFASLVLLLRTFTTLASNACSLGQAIPRLSIALCKSMIRWFEGTSSPRTHGLEEQTITLDLRCVSWILQTSLDKAIYLSALKYLATMPELTHFDSTLIMGCFNVFTNCINVTNDKVMAMGGLEQLATVSARCLLRTFCHLSVTDPTSSALADVRRRYKKVFSPDSDLDFTGLPFRCTMNIIHILVNQCRNPRHILWGDDIPSAQEHTVFSQYMVNTAQVEYQRTQRRKVPRWMLRFVLYVLSLDPPPPVSAVANYLEIIAIDLGCDLSSDTPLTER